MRKILCEQRSPEWHAARRGVFTASDYGPFLIGTYKESADARQNFIDKKLGEIFDGDGRIKRPDGTILAPRDFQDYDMERGAILEPLALKAFEKHTGRSTESVGFVLHPTCDFLGCSPDFLVTSELEDEGGEMKCPSGKIQVKRLREKMTPNEYLYQIHGSMIITRAKVWHFWSWHPKLPPVHTVEVWSEFTDRLEQALLRLVDEMKLQFQQLRSERPAA